MLPRGDEEEWRWYSFGGNMVGTLVAETVYSECHELPRTGQKLHGKMSMLECAKIHFYCEPWACNPATRPQTTFIKFALSANGVAPHLTVGTFVMQADKVLQRPDIYFVHTELRHMFETTLPTTVGTYPYAYDVSAPSGQGILFKGNKIWTHYVSLSGHTPFDVGTCNFTFRCLCRVVFVDPAYYTTSAIEAGNIGSDT